MDAAHARPIRVAVADDDEQQQTPMGSIGAPQSQLQSQLEHHHDEPLHTYYGHESALLPGPPSPSSSSSSGRPSSQQQQQHGPSRSVQWASHPSPSPPLPSPSGAPSPSSSSFHYTSSSSSSHTHVRVHADGVTATSPRQTPLASARSLVRAAYSCYSQSQIWHLLLYSAFFVYLVIIPMAFALAFYLDLLQLLISVVFALALPFTIYHVLWKAESQRHRQERERERERRRAHARPQGHEQQQQDPQQQQEEEEASQHSSGLLGGFEVVSKHYVYEMYQLLLTLLSCATYLFYTYKLRFSYEGPLHDETSGALVSEERGDYDLPLSDRVAFVQVEYFLIVSLSLDYLLRLVSARHKLVYALSFYSIIDLLCFTGVAYFSFWHAQLAPSDTIYNYYLFQAPCRFLRMRRALQSLDAPIRRRNGAGLALYRLGPWALTKRSAFFVLLILRVVLFLFTAAALVLAFEFPCVARAVDPLACSAELQRFHLCVYFVIVSLSTVGYGDITCHTDGGRMLMAVIIVFAVITVPREIQAFSDLDAEQKEEAAKQAAREATLVERARVLAQAQRNQAGEAEAGSSGNGGNNTGASGATAAAGSGSAALSAFLSDDRAFLCRWAQTQLSHTVAARPALLEQLAHALELPPLVTDRDSPRAQCRRVVLALFGGDGGGGGGALSYPSESSSPPAAAAFPSHPVAAAAAAASVALPLPRVRHSRRSSRTGSASPPLPPSPSQAHAPAHAAAWHS